MQPITKDNCDFPTLRQNGCVYVDKTACFHRLAKDPQAHLFFLARPRRFGKSLMISTLKAMFQGRKDLFEGLAIMDTDWDWEKEKRPVIHLNMGLCAAADYETFAATLPGCVERALASAGAPYDSAKMPSENFGNAIDYLSDRGSPPAILIDEYDDPVARALKNPEVAERVRVPSPPSTAR